MVIFVILLVLIVCLFIYLCLYAFCREKKEVIRVTRYGSILDRDPDLGKDNMVYSPYTIGLNDDSAISEVAPIDNEYLNMSHISKEDAIRKMTHMIPEDADIHQQMDEELKDSEIDSNWIPVSEPSRNSHSKTTFSFKFDQTRNSSKSKIEQKKRATFFRG